MKRLVVASSNEGKVREFRRALADIAPSLQLLSAQEAGVTQFPPEVGLSYEENAAGKALHATRETGLPSLGDDSGLEVNALDGAPGIYSARFGGDLTDTERVAYLLERLQDVPAEARTARFVCALVLVLPGGQTETFQGECRGKILTCPRGADGFGYDPVFYSHNLQKTFAEVSGSEKEHVSHRGRALSALGHWLSRQPSVKAES